MVSLFFLIYTLISLLSVWFIYALSHPVLKAFGSGSCLQGIPDLNGEYHETEGLAPLAPFDIGSNSLSGEYYTPQFSLSNHYSQPASSTAVPSNKPPISESDSCSSHLPQRVSPQLDDQQIPLPRQSLLSSPYLKLYRMNSSFYHSCSRYFFFFQYTNGNLGVHHSANPIPFFFPPLLHISPYFSHDPIIILYSKNNK